MTQTETGHRRRRAVGDFRRGLILDSARAVFETEGLEGASLRAIAAAAGYTPAALYFHFDSKEALYAAVLADSLAALGTAVDAAVECGTAPGRRLAAAALAFYDFYAANPRDLELGFYLFRGGMRPRGLGRDRDRALNAALQAALAPIGHAAEALGQPPERAAALTAELFAHATGLLLLAHTRRIRLFGLDPRGLMARQVDRILSEIAPEATSC